MGWFYDDGDPEPGESHVHTDVVSTVYVPLPGGAPVIRRLVRTADGLQWTLERDGVEEQGIPEDSENNHR